MLPGHPRPVIDPCRPLPAANWPLHIASRYWSSSDLFSGNDG